jgi:predicted dehydrogenase
MTRLGLVGAGGVGHAFFDVVRGMPGVSVEAICDVSADRLREVAQEQNIGNAYTSLQDMLRADIDTVALSTPIQVHGAQAIAAMKAGKHVLCQYIAAMDLHEAEELLRTSQTSGCKYMFIETDCYERRNVVMQALARKGVLGELTIGRGHYIHDCKTMGRSADGSLTWRGELWMESPGGRVSAVHNAMPLLEVFGERVVEVYSYGPGARTMPEYTKHDRVTTVGRLPSGRVVELVHRAVQGAGEPAGLAHDRAPPGHVAGLRASSPGRSRRTARVALRVEDPMPNLGASAVVIQGATRSQPRPTTPDSTPQFGRGLGTSPRARWLPVAPRARSIGVQHGSASPGRPGHEAENAYGEPYPGGLAVGGDLPVPPLGRMAGWAMRPAVLLALLLAVLLSPATAVLADKCTCCGEYRSVGPPFRVHGRLSIWNGNPAVRIWIVGTHRMLGIRDGTAYPTNLEQLLVSPDTEVFGDFVVCPLTRYKKGVMQVVCVDSASNLRVSQRP